jgi:hypothetical protein
MQVNINKYNKNINMITKTFIGPRNVTFLVRGRLWNDNSAVN